MKHKHEWRFAPNIEDVSPARTNTYGFYCTISECDEYILLSEVERRLNATEYMPVKRARDIGRKGPRGSAEIWPLLKYADILEDA